VVVVVHTIASVNVAADLEDVAFARGLVGLYEKRVMYARRVELLEDEDRIQRVRIHRVQCAGELVG
jgi:hypothetical protein